MEFEKLDLHSLSETVQSRKVKTSVANLCLFLNTLDAIYFNTGFFSTPRVNHHFVNLHKLDHPVGSACTLMQIFEADAKTSTTSEVAPVTAEQGLVHDKIFSSLVVAFYKVESGDDSTPLYHCNTQRKLVGKSKCISFSTVACT